MKVSIITATFNSALTIENNLQSIENQTYKNIEHIIIDGKSTDKTLEKIKKYEKNIFKIISEKDNGIYDALNKGIENSNGDIICFLHSDDFFFNEHVIENVVKSFKKNPTDSLYGDLFYVDFNDTNKIIRYWRSQKFQRKLFEFGWMPAHTTFFVKKEIYKKFGKFNLDLKISADYELMLRFLYKNCISTQYLPEIIVKMRVGGKSNASIKNRIIANKEDKKAWKINNLKLPFYTIYLKPIRKIFQFFNKFR